MLEPLNAVVHFPTMPMGRFGLIPEEFGGGPLYRCIWAPSRTIVVQPESGVQTLFMYTGPRALNPLSVNSNTWILEKWLPPWKLYSGTEDDWNQDPDQLATGFYPKRGDYVLCEALSGQPSLESVEKTILMIEDGPNRHREVDNTLDLVARMEKGQADKKKKKRDIIYNRMRPWGAESYSSALSMRNSKTYEQPRSANELGLPAPGATATFKRRKREVFKVPVTI